MHLTKLHRERKLTDVTDFQWLRQTRYYWRYTTGMHIYIYTLLIYNNTSQAFQPLCTAMLFPIACICMRNQ
jgi:hypothetical protein